VSGGVLRQPSTLAGRIAVATAEADTPTALHPPMIVARKFSDIVEETVQWHWQDWIAKGKLHLCAGVQGDGKSTILTDIAARLSSGRAMPDGVAVSKKRIGFLISEEGVADTVLPRLRVHHAYLDNILWLEAVRTGDADAPLSLSAHLPLLEQFIYDNQLDVLVIDALSDFLGPIRRNDEGEVRSVLTPLSQLAGRTGCSVVGIAHLGKPGAGSRRAVERVLGSGAFTQVPRIVWAVSVDAEDETKRYFGTVKNNLAPDVPTYAWHRDRDKPIEWDGVSATSIRTMMSGAAEKTSQIDRAKTFLAERLMGGGRPGRQLITDAANEGIGKNTLYAAADELGVEKKKENGVAGQWYWRLPTSQPDTPHTQEGRSVSSVSLGTSGRSGTLTWELPDLPNVPEDSELTDVASGDSGDDSIPLREVA